jgi:hypothetical protein
MNVINLVLNLYKANREKDKASALRNKMTENLIKFNFQNDEEQI